MDSLNLPDNFTYLPISDQDDEHVFRIKEITDKKSAYAWVELYSEQTKSTWRTATTFPNSGRVNLFKVVFRCVHNTDRRATGVRPSKHTGCDVKLTICIKKYIERSEVRINDLLNKEYPTVVSLKGSHNHPIATCDALKYRDLSSDIKMKFLKLFKYGHSAASALRSHKTDLLLEYGEDYPEIAIDGKYLPSYSIVYKLYQNEVRKEYETFLDERNIFESLEEYLNDYVKNTGAVAQFKSSSDNEHYFVVICTPIMLRAYEKLSQTSDSVMLDASRDVNQDGHQIYFFVAPSVAGSIPIGIIITDTENESVFIEAVQCLRDCLPKTEVIPNQYPHIFLIDNDLTVFSGLKEGFPSSILLLCHFHVLKSVWKWLTDDSHSIQKENRQELFFKFRKLLYSDDQDTAKQNLIELVESANQLNHTNFVSYVTKYMDHETMWISFYRENLSIRSNSSNDYADLVFCLLKNCILKNKVKSFNIIQLVDLIVSQYEMFHKKRLTDFWNGKYTNIFLKKMVPHEIPENFSIQSKGFGIFSVTDEKNEVFYLSLEQGMCSCPESSGELCRHLSALLLKLDSDIMTAHDMASSGDKEIIFYIANGAYPQNDMDFLVQTIQTSPLIILQLSKEPNENVSEIDTNITHISNNDDITVVQHIEPLTFKEEEELEAVFSRIKEGLRKDPNNYVPAVRAFLENVGTLNDTGLLTGLYNFGSYNYYEEEV